MNIVVCVKYVPDATGDRRFEADNTVDRVGVDGLLSELDEYAVEQALRVKEGLGGDAGGVVVTVLTVGPERAGDAVRKALQMGADAGVHVCDEGIGGSDAMGTSLVLAEAVRRIGAGLGEGPGFDLVLCGMGSTDAGMGVLPAMLSERLGIPGATFAGEIEVAGSESGGTGGTGGTVRTVRTVRIRREGDAASVVAEASLPAVASVTDQSGEPRYPSFKGIMAAKKKPVETWTLADLGVDAGRVGAAGAYTAVLEVQARPPRTAGQVVVDEDGSGARALVEFLASRKFV
jgi:electron transfer flavoprotein beta subunit